MADEAQRTENPVSSSLRKSTRTGGALPVGLDPVDDGNALDGDGALSYGAMVRSRCKPCGAGPWSAAGRHDDVDDLRFIDNVVVGNHDPAFGKSKPYQDLKISELCMLGIQHYFAVVTSVTGLAGLMAGRGECKGSDLPGGGNCFV